MLPRPGVIGSFLSAEVGMRGSPMEPAHQAKLWQVPGFDAPSPAFSRPLHGCSCTRAAACTGMLCWRVPYVRVKIRQSTCLIRFTCVTWDCNCVQRFLFCLSQTSRAARVSILSVLPRSDSRVVSRTPLIEPAAININVNEFTQN